MAEWKTQAWVTSAVNNDSVENALVLGKSIRRTKTTRKITVITSMNTTLENRCALRQVFDLVFLLDESFAPGGVAKGLDGDAQAKAYTFALILFEKCVFVASDSLILENLDNLFDSSFNYGIRISSENGLIDTSFFMLKPDKDIWKTMWEGAQWNGRNMTNAYLSKWLGNQKAALQIGKLPDNLIGEFNLATGSLKGEQATTPIIRLVGGGKVSEHMMALQHNQNVSLNGKVVRDMWLDILALITEGLNIPQNLLSWDEENRRVSYMYEPIAIVGMSCRYPGANTLEEFWNMLYAGEEGIRECPAFRWNKEHTLRVTQQDKKSQAGFLSVPVDEFDARFFGVSPKEAAYMDPQTRLLHEVMWESLEDAGIDPLSLYGTHAGIFTGSWMNDYKDIVQCSAERDFFRTYMGNSIGAAAARLSFLLGLTGPSIATESGCSSAIVALDLAVKSLRNGETNLAMAGGVNLLLHPFNSNMMEYVISPDGRCKTFDSKANGFGRAEGCGVLVLKRMGDALRDRDHIWGLIRGSAVSQEGLSRSLGTPTVHCEALAMKLALQDANIRPEQVSFVETHGTGTQVGDPMEVAAIAKAYYSPMRKEPLIIGSVKTNVGHTESCSGITGIMKAVLALQHEIIPKHRNLETINPEIFLDSIPATIPLEPVVWPRVQDQPRICGVSSFGITGTDGHVILEEAPDYELPKFTLGLERPVHLMTISGKTSDALEELLGEYENRFSEHADADTASLANEAYSANVGRAAFSHRTFIVANNFEEARRVLKDKSFLLGEVKEGHRSQICFLFTGQGSQYQGMAKMLYETSPIFRISFDACDRTLRENYNLSIRKVLWDSDPSSKELSRTIFSQTSIFCVEYCLLKLWQSWGIQPDYVLGHSLGEFCAAVAAGVLTFEDALKLVAERSRLIDNLPKGSMLVIKASKPEVEKWMNAAKIDLDFAAVNNPEQTVVAGDTKTVDDFLAYLKCHGTKAIILEATHAFHSRHMDPMLEGYQKVAQSIKYKQGNSNIQYVSGMEGRLIDDVTELGADYWVRHTREKVSFIDACTVLRELGCQDFLEVGPQPVLSSFVMSNNDGTPLNCFPSLRKGTNDWETILTSLGKLYLLGYPVDWKGYDNTYIRKKVSLPFHPFHRKSFWVDCTNDQAAMIHPLVGYPMKNASALSIFQNDLTLKSVPYIKDHCIGSRVVFPGAGYTEMCLSAGYCVANGLIETFEQPTRAMKLENVRIDAPLELKEGKVCRLQVIVDLPENSSESGFRVKVFHQNTLSAEEYGKWVLHASSTFLPVGTTKECLTRWNAQKIPEILSSTQSTSPDDFYSLVDEQGLRFGDNFRMIRKFWTVRQPNLKRGADEVVTEIQLPADWNKYLLHPLIIDAVFQTGILTRFRYEASKLRVPVRIGEFTLLTGITPEMAEKSSSLYLYAVTDDTGKVSVFVATQNWIPVAYINDVELIETNVRTIESVLELQSSPVPDAWEETWKVIPSPFTTSVEIPVDVVPFVENAPQFVDNDEDVYLYHQTNSLLYYYILNALQQLGWQPKPGNTFTVASFCSHLQIKSGFHQLTRFYFTVLQQQAGLLEQVDELSGTWRVVKVLPSPEVVSSEIARLLGILKASKVGMITGIYEHLAPVLGKILRGEESALNILFPQEEDKQQFSADSYYQNHPGRSLVVTGDGVIVQNIFEESFRLNQHPPGKIYRILEVGSGLGSMSQWLLKWLKERWGDKFEFYYTDISQTFFIKAAKKFEEFKENVKFQVFNIEHSPLSQGIPLGYFDMVCATDVLHATRNLEETLVHLRQTLKPEGVIFFTETVIPATDITFVFGLLEGYWRYEDKQWRQHHCCVGEGVWKQVLENCGFDRVHWRKKYVNQFAFIMATASRDVEVRRLKVSKKGLEKEEKKRWLVFGDAENEEVTNKVASILDMSGFQVQVVWREDKVPIEGSVASGLNEGIGQKVVGLGAEEEIKRILNDGEPQGLVYLWGMDLHKRNQSQVALPFLNVAKGLVAMLKPPNVLVVTRGVQAVNEDTILVNPCAATLNGMIKSLKNETSDMVIKCLDLEAEAGVEKMVEQIVYEVGLGKGLKEQQRLQVAYRGGIRQEPRLIKAVLPTPSDTLKLPPSTDRYHLKLPASRMIQDLEFVHMEEEELVGANDIEVRVKAYALNFRDIFAIIKPSKEFEKLNAVGLDFAGVVTKVGFGSNWKVGQRVFGCNYKEDQLPSHYVLDSRSVREIPEDMTFWEAATLPAVFSTAYHCLMIVARMKKGDKVLIHTGSGGVGLAAIQLAKDVGAEIITTAGNPRKRAYLRSLGIEHVFKSRDTSYEQDILRVTNGKGVDIVLNSITGPGIKEATLRATARNGRFVEMSKLSTWTPEEVKAMRPDVDYNIVDLSSLDWETSTELLVRLSEFVEGRRLVPIPFVKFDALHVRQALQYFQKAKHIGKVVVSMPEVSTQKGQFKTQVALFNDNSTYLITGGLGGIGFEVCKWMLGLGATDIVITGRNPPKPEVAEQIRKLNEKGNNVMVRLGDVGNQDHCKALIDEITGSMKPLRGVMHCAGVLRDNLYANQTWADFETTYHPKVKGTWNLHQLTEKFQLEHFVVYSSLTALLGTPGQPNHSSANCFEDALIHYRHSLGLPGTTINWGQWSQVGCAKEASMSGVLPVSMQRMLNGMEVALRANKRQVCFSEFDSFPNLCMMCPMVRNYLDDRLWKQFSDAGTTGHGSVKAEQFWQEMDEVATKAEKVGVLCTHLKVILRQALRLEPDEPLNEDANIQELGVDSLMMIELKNSLQTLLGSRVTVTASVLKNCNTIRMLATAVVGKMMEEDGDEEEVPLEPLPGAELLELLKRDSILDERIQILPEVKAAVKPSQIRNVLVTGVTGQIGPYLVAKLSQLPIDKIWCLVRGEDGDGVVAEKLKSRLDTLELTPEVDLEKVECVAGNVARENLGLSAEKYKQLCESVDAVIHCAAKTHPSEHFRPETGKFTDIRSVNVVGTLNVIKFACAGKVKHVFYPSTLLSGVFGNNVEGRLADSWPEPNVIQTIVDNKFPGLQSSKWLCEMLLEQANQRGVPCKVFRLPWTGGHSQTGRVDVLGNLYILRFLSFLKLGAMSDVVIPSNVLPVDVCVDLALKLFFRDDTPNEILNLAHPLPQVEQEFVRIASEEFGKQIETLSTQELAERVKSQGDTEVEGLKDMFQNQSLISNYFSNAADFVTGYLAHPDTFFRNEKMDRLIENYGRDFEPTMEVVRRDLRYLKEKGLLDKFGI